MQGGSNKVRQQRKSLLNKKTQRTLALILFLIMGVTLIMPYLATDAGEYEGSHNLYRRGVNQDDSSQLISRAEGFNLHEFGSSEAGTDSTHLSTNTDRSSCYNLCSVLQDGSPCNNLSSVLQDGSSCYNLSSVLQDESPSYNLSSVLLDGRHVGDASFNLNATRMDSVWMRVGFHCGIEQGGQSQCNPMEDARITGWTSLTEGYGLTHHWRSVNHQHPQYFLQLTRNAYDPERWDLVDDVFVCPRCGRNEWVSFSNMNEVPDGSNIQLSHPRPEGPGCNLPVDSIPDVRAEIHIDTIRRTSAAFVDPTAVLFGDDKINNVGVEYERFLYNVNFRSTSNVAADSFVVELPLESTTMNVDHHLIVEGFWTPVVYGSSTGLFNLYVEIDDATWILYQEGLPTTQQQFISFDSLYQEQQVTGIRLDFGAVGVGFTSWNAPIISLNGEHREGSHTPIDLSNYDNSDLIRLIDPAYLEPRAFCLEGNEIEDLLSFLGHQAGSITPLNARSNLAWDWTPPSNEDAGNFSQGALLATGLQPASFVVSAADNTHDEVFVRSATAKIEADFDTFTMIHKDQDGVRTLVLPYFHVDELGDIDLWEAAVYNSNTKYVESNGGEYLGITTRLIRSEGDPGGNPPGNGGTDTEPYEPYSGGESGDTPSADSPQTGDVGIRIIQMYILLLILSVIVITSVILVQRGRRKVSHTAMKSIFGFFCVMLLMVPVLSTYAHPSSILTKEIVPNYIEQGTQVIDQVVMQQRFREGDELVIPERITLEGRDFIRTSISEAERVAVVTETRTTTIRVEQEGILTDELLELFGSNHISLRREYIPVQDFISEQRHFTGITHNCVDQFAVHLDNGLTKAAVSFVVTETDTLGMPIMYDATVTYRGVLNGTNYVYIISEGLFQFEEVVQEFGVYLVTAIFVPMDQMNLYFCTYFLNDIRSFLVVTDQ